jgi:tRNA1(Val) A37 N6-methylase TrmN6
MDNEQGLRLVTGFLAVAITITWLVPLPPIRPADRRSPSGGIVRAPRRPVGWRAPGPRPTLCEAMPGDGVVVPPGLWPSAVEDLCWLAGDFRILQRLDGHRWSLDDLMTAWVAARARPDARRIFDLGCGIGTVLLFLAWRFPAATLVGVEAQAESACLARRSVVWNDVGGRVEVRDGDLRDPAATPYGPVFDLVSGTPPYFPPGTGVESTRPQCAPCRFEHRGGVEVYVEAVARVLAPDGRAVRCLGASQAHRVGPAVERAGLSIAARLDIVPRVGKAVLLSLFTIARGSRGEPMREDSMIIRERDGQWTDDFRRVREDLGMPPGMRDETR